MGQFFDPLLIISMTTFCLNNSLQSSWHAFYKMLACFWRDIVPFLGQSLPQFKYSFGWSFIGVHVITSVLYFHFHLGIHSFDKLPYRRPRHTKFFNLT